MKFKTFRNRSSGQMINYEIANVKDLVKIIHDVGNEIEKYKDIRSKLREIFKKEYV